MMMGLAVSECAMRGIPSKSTSLWNKVTFSLDCYLIFNFILSPSHDSDIYFPFYCFLIVVLAPAGKFNLTTLLYDIAQCVRLLWSIFGLIHNIFICLNFMFLLSLTGLLFVAGPSGKTKCLILIGHCFCL